MTRKRLVRWGVVIICLYLIVTTSRAIVDLWRAGDKLTRREQELAALLVQQKELLRKKAEVESQEYLEKMARNELGLSKPGEEVIIIPKELLAQGPQPVADNTPNWKKWMKLFF